MKPVGDATRKTTLELALQDATTKDAALRLVLAEAERAMSRLSLINDPATKKAANAEARSLLDRAEQIKVTGCWGPKADVLATSTPTGSPRRVLRHPTSSRTLSKTEQIILLKASYVNGCKLPPWKGEPPSADFELAPDGTLHEDPTAFTLSVTQLASFAEWRRPTAMTPLALSQNIELSVVSSELSTLDLVQDAATDCSVVASLCTAVARATRGHTSMLRGVMFPFDDRTGMPDVAPNGKYIARMNVNGTFRSIEIDDRLPMSKDERIIHVIDRQHPTILWPALIEKLYLKVRGGYDFPGSNSGTDLWIFAGWIPEQVFLESEDTSPVEVWDRMWKAHENGDVLVTLGTGKISEEHEREIGLASEHSYAVLDLREVDSQKLLLIKNPWFQGTTWKSQSSTTELVTGDDAVRSPRDLLNADHQLSPGTFWMDLGSVTQYFESIYLNWNPGLFSHREDMHFAWDLAGKDTSSTYVNHPQFSILVQKRSVVWVLLCRHFLDNEKQLCQETGSASGTEVSRPGYIGMSLFDTAGKELDLKDQALYSTPFVDSYQALLRLPDLDPCTRYTLVPDQDGLPAPRHTFSLSSFANSPITIEPAFPLFSHSMNAAGSWTEDSTGGNTSSPIFSTNPQFRIALAKPTALSIVLISQDKTIPVNVKLCISGGNRIQNIRTRDILADSHTYRPCCAKATAAMVEAGIYTIVCSTYEVGQLSIFTLRIQSEQPVQIRAFPKEGAGRLRASVSPVTFSLDDQAFAIPLLPQRLTKFVSLVKHRPAQSAASRRVERSMIRLRIVQGDAFQHRVLAANAEDDFQDSLSGVRTDEVDLSPSMARDAHVWLVVERNFTARTLEQETFIVEIFTESAGAVQSGRWQEWEIL